MKKSLKLVYLVLVIFFLIIVLFFFDEVHDLIFTGSQPKFEIGIAKFTFELRDMQLQYHKDPFTSELTCEVQGWLVVENYSPKTLAFDLVLAKFYAGDKLICTSKQYMYGNDMVYTHYVLPGDSSLPAIPDSNYSSQQDFILGPNIQLVFNIASIYNFGAYRDKAVEVSLYKGGQELLTRKFKYKENNKKFEERST